MVVFDNVKKEELEQLKWFSREKGKTIYEEARFIQEDVALVLYTSGKLLVQGKKEAVEKTAKLLRKLGIGEEAKSEKFRLEKGWMIGSDESLKGDTFGGIVVAAVKADNEIRKKLLELGVADSKLLSDGEVLALAEKIKPLAECEVKSLLPEEYNYYKGKVTKLLNKLHQECARDLQPGIHVVDKYPGCAVGDIQEEKAESKYIEVAAASVLARAAALQQLDYLSMQVGFPLPKGSIRVKEALQKLKERGSDLKKLVKIDFQNVKEFL